MPSSDTQPEIVAYKGFNLDWTCMGMQYEVGKSYTHDGEVVACSSGLHACEYPLDVFGYYPPASSRYAEVQQSGQLSRDGGDTKIASARLTVTVELSLSEMISRAMQWVFSRATPENTEHATGYQGAASATGYRGAASATGSLGAANATGSQGAASATGEHGAAVAIGHDSRVMGADGNALFLVYRDPETEEIKRAWAGIVGRDGIRAGVWYSLGPDGRPVEVS